MRTHHRDCPYHPEGPACRCHTIKYNAAVRANALSGYVYRGYAIVRAPEGFLVYPLVSDVLVCTTATVDEAKAAINALNAGVER